MSSMLPPSGVTQTGWEFVVDGHASGFRPVFCHQCEAAGECQARTPCASVTMSEGEK